MSLDKVFIYLVRPAHSGLEVLAFHSHDEPGFEVPKGSVEPGESLRQAVHRELLEEAGVADIKIRGKLGWTRWQDERQHFFLARLRSPLPDRFEHVVTGQDRDCGLRYVFLWLPVDAGLADRLVQGCNRYVQALVHAVPLESAQL